MITRRHFLISTAASLFMPALTFTDDAMRLRAEAIQRNLLPSQDLT